MSQAKMNNAFQVLMTEAPNHAKVWSECFIGLDQASTLDKKTEELVYIAVLAAVRLYSSIPFHVLQAKKSGAAKSDIISAVLTGLPAAGNCVVEALPKVIEAYDS
jgi:alkylhydroperoxidase/carboxymuconolactone decarboxylase family protein YurZ